MYQCMQVVACIVLSPIDVASAAGMVLPNVSRHDATIQYMVLLVVLHNVKLTLPLDEGWRCPA